MPQVSVEKISVLSHLLTAAHHSSAQKTRLGSSSTRLTHFLQGGLPFGSICEWGLPWGYETRDLILSFLDSNILARFDPSPWTLWIHARSDTLIYPPAWQARNIDLTKISFAYSQKPVHDLKTAFLSSFFKIVIIDLEASHLLSHDDWAFLAQIARKNHMLVMVLQNYSLTSQKGNVWAKIRLNGWKQTARCLTIQSLKGLPPKTINLTYPPSLWSCEL